MERHPFAITLDQLDRIPASIPHWCDGLPGIAPEEDTYAPREAVAHADRFVANSCSPELFPYPAGADNTGLCVLICPGGGYAGQAIDKEGHDIARFLNSFGVGAFVLKYRVPAVAYKRVVPAGPYLAPIADVLRAMRFLRAHAAEYGIRKLGVMGFSAGGHLAAMASTRYEDALEPDAALAAIPARPDFTILMYPVATLLPPFAHMGSRKYLLDEDASEELAAQYSAEKLVNAQTPPCFLAQAEDDVVPVENSLLYFRACRENNVPAEMHLFPAGGHGYGMYQRDLAVDTWPQRMKEWLLRMA